MLRFWLEHLGAAMVTGGAWRRRLVFARVRDSAELLTPCRGLQFQGAGVTGWRTPALIGRPAETRERVSLAWKMLVNASGGGLGTVSSQRWRPR